MTSRGGDIVLHASGLRFTARSAGELDAPLVIGLHGFPDTPDTFGHQVGPLVAAGYRVITPVLRGYEPSSQPADHDFSLLTLAGDVVEWLDELGIDRAHLVGHDWGAAITYVTAAHHPDRVRTATALAIPPLARIPDAVRRVPRQILRSWYMTFFQLRGVSDRSLAAGDWRLMRRLWRVWSPGYDMSQEQWVALRSHFEQPGVAASALAYYRQNATPPVLLGLRSTPAMTRAEVPVPTLIVNGSDDGCMDRRLYDAAIRSEDYPAGVRHVELDGAGHFVHREQPDLVNDAILAHLGTP